MPRREEEAQHCTKAEKKKNVWPGYIVPHSTQQGWLCGQLPVLPLPGSICGIARGEETYLPSDRHAGMLAVRIASFVKLYFSLFFVRVVALALCSCVSVIGCSRKLVFDNIFVT